MNTSINWLHFSDLHFGCEGQNWMWPTIREELFRDIENRGKALGGWDLVFFTGDIVNSGQQTEFDKVNVELTALWRAIEKASGRVPKICVVPGNHDLVRPPPNSAELKVIQTLWWSDGGIRQQFWKDEKSDYRIAVNTAFSNYTTWLKALPLPRSNFVHGLLPGDFSTTVTKDNITLGIIGLNTTFLQLSGGDYSGKLDIHATQIMAVCNGDPVQWVKSNTASILLTHQPPSWLNASSREHFRQEIYPPGRFVSHLFGHEHVPESYGVSEAGAPHRHFRQAPSLFGLEHWDGAVPTKRIHGYNAGQFTFTPTGCYETLWPRIAVRMRDGSLHIVPDYTYRLKEDECVTTLLDNAQPEIPPPALPPDERRPPTESNLPILSAPLDEVDALKNLLTCPRLVTAPSPHHKQIRLEEQSQVEAKLRTERQTWIVADWGLGKEQFLACCLDRFKAATTTIEIFHLKCDDSIDTDAVETAFVRQFAMPLQKFSGFAAYLQTPFLILDELHPALCTGNGLAQLRRVVAAILDFAPSLRIICTSRLPPEDNSAYITLSPLALPDVKTYIGFHPDAAEQLREPETIDRIHERSEGLPMHIDRLLRELKVSSLASVLESDLEREMPPEILQETPKALVHAVTALERSDDKRAARSFRLLKVLTVLQYGETIESLHHYLSTEPFFAQHALLLHTRALIDIIPLRNTTAAVSSESRSTIAELPKVLKVPRQVRDYVTTLMASEEIDEIVSAGIMHYFGREWREGKVKLRSAPPEYREYLNSGVGNEFVLIHHLIKGANAIGDKDSTRRALALALQYSRRLNESSRFRDLSAVVGTLLPLIDPAGFAAEWSRLAVMYADGLRMTSGTEKDALKYHKEALEVGDKILSDAEKADIWVSIALNEQWLKNKDEAIGAAKNAIKLSEKNSGSHLQAEVMVAELSLEGEERRKKLTALERKSRELGFTTTANNILFTLLKEEKGNTKRVEFADKILSTETTDYTAARAILLKANEKTAGNIPLDNNDIAKLCLAYGYFYSQRFSSLMEMCHQMLWSEFERRGDGEQLHRLFRYSSFIWRIRGQDEIEGAYLTKLSNFRSQHAGAAEKVSGLFEVKYFVQRLKVLIIHR